MKMKICSKCKVEKELSNFYERKDAQGGYRSICKPCHNSDGLKRYRKNGGSEARKKITYKWNIKNLYNLETEDFNNMYEEQGGKCLICDTELRNVFKEIEGSKTVVDHCHDTEQVRGLLCGTCNSGIGLLKDDIELLKKAIKYLET